MKIQPAIFTLPIARFVAAASAIIAVAGNLHAQAKPGQTLQPEESMFSSWTFYLGVIAIIGLIGLAVAMRRKAADVVKSITGKKPGGITMTYREGPPKDIKRPRPPKPAPKPVVVKEGFAALPVSEFTRLQRANAFIQLPESHDPSLLEAIEQTNEDSEEEAQVRTQALKQLSTFKTSNSVSAIAQMALYDLSSKLRSDAVLQLAEFDHESVFETIVTCCADPTREVRASAARALFKLTFDRASAWARIIESGDVARMRHTARSAIEGDLVERSFDRLIHTDKKIAYEAFTLTALLVKAGETEPVYKALADHRVENVKLALLHVLQTIRADETFDGLSDLMSHHELSPKIADKVNEVRSMMQMTHA